VLKRLFDILISATALVALAPVLVVLAILIRVRLGSPVLFAQLRPGLGGRPFRMIKFRSMTSERGPDGQLRPDD